MYQELHFMQLETRRRHLQEELALARARWDAAATPRPPKAPRRRLFRRQRAVPATS